MFIPSTRGGIINLINARTNLMKDNTFRQTLTVHVLTRLKDVLLTVLLKQKHSKFIPSTRRRIVEFLTEKMQEQI